MKVAQLNRYHKNAHLLFLKQFFLEMMSRYFIVRDYESGLEDWILETPNRWFMVNFSPIERATPNTVLLTMIRSLPGKDGNSLDGVCGKKMKDYLLSCDIVVSNGSACKVDSSSYGSVVLTQASIPTKL